MKKNLFIAAAAFVALASCSDESFVGENSPTNPDENGTEAIVFTSNAKGLTRADFIGATAAEKLGNMFVVEGTKGTEQSNSPSTTVVFDNYLVGYTANTAGTKESNTNNWEYVGLQSGITGKLSGTTWTALHNGSTDAKSQTVKYWDYSTSQYDFIAWSTGGLEAVTDAAVSGSKVKVTRINTGDGLATDGFTLTAASADDLLKCYYTDINKVLKANYGQPVTLTFKSMAAKVRVALYETVPGYSVKDVKFYSADSDKDGTAAYDPKDLGTGTSTTATLFTTASTLPKSGAVLVYYPHIGSDKNALADYNKANVTVTGGTTGTTQTFDALTAQYSVAEANEVALVSGATLTSEQATAVNDALNLTGGAAYATDGTATISAAHATAYNAAVPLYLGRKITEATFAGDATKDFYTAVVPNQNGQPLTLRVDYTLVSTDGSGEVIHVYGAKAVVPATYTVWQPNYAYTYIFKISDNSNGWTSQTSTDPNGLFPITFDAVVTSFTDANAEQTTVTTVATPSITTYQQGHDIMAPAPAYDEYSRSQKAGKDQTNVKDLYVQVMDNSTTTPSLATLTAANSLLFNVTTSSTPISEASVMDALQNRTNTKDDASPIGRNGITLTTNANIAVSGSGTFTTIVNGVDDNPITVDDGKAAKIDIDNAGVTTGTYAFVYITKAPTADEKIYHVAAGVKDASTAANYYEVTPAMIGATAKSAGDKAAAGKVYFVKNVDAKGAFVSWTFKQTKVGDDVEGLYEASIPVNKASSYTEGNFYFDVYNQNNGAYAVKVFKVVN